MCTNSVCNIGDVQNAFYVQARSATNAPGDESLHVMSDTCHLECCSGWHGNNIMYCMNTVNFNTVAMPMHDAFLSHFRDRCYT